jgi:hypothetical protein
MTKFTVEVYRNDRWEVYCEATPDRPFAQSMYALACKEYDGTRVRLVAHTVVFER